MSILFNHEVKFNATNSKEHLDTPAHEDPKYVIVVWSTEYGVLWARTSYAVFATRISQRKRHSTYRDSRPPISVERLLKMADFVIVQISLFDYLCQQRGNCPGFSL